MLFAVLDKSQSHLYALDFAPLLVKGYALQLRPSRIGMAHRIGIFCRDRPQLLPLHTAYVLRFVVMQMARE